MGKPRKKYSRSYKLEVVSRSFEVENVADLARELGLNPNQIYNWRSAFAKEGDQSFPGEGNKALSLDEAEKELLRKQLREKELELKILKKAIGIFSKKDGRSTSL